MYVPQQRELLISLKYGSLQGKTRQRSRILESLDYRSRVWAGDRVRLWQQVTCSRCIWRDGMGVCAGKHPQGNEWKKTREGTAHCCFSGSFSVTHRTCQLSLVYSGAEVAERLLPFCSIPMLSQRRSGIMQARFAYIPPKNHGCRHTFEVSRLWRLKRCIFIFTVSLPTYQHPVIDTTPRGIMPIAIAIMVGNDYGENCMLVKDFPSRPWSTYRNWENKAGNLFEIETADKCYPQQLSCAFDFIFPVLTMRFLAELLSAKSLRVLLRTIMNAPQM